MRHRYPTELELLPRNAPKQLPLIYFVLIGMVSPVAMNIIVPALPLISQSLNASASLTQLSLSIYLLTMGFGQLFAGALADLYGRKPVLLIGFLLHLTGCVLAFLTPNVEGLLLGRLLQALGASAGLIIARTLILEHYPANQAGGKLAYLTMGIALAQAIVPIIGGYLSEVFSWRIIFIIPMVMTVLVWLFTLVKLPSDSKKTQERFSSRQTLASFAALIRTPNYLRFVIASTSVGAGYFLFLGAAPYIVVNTLNGSAADFGQWFILVALGFMAGSFVSANLSARLGLKRMVLTGLVLSTAGVLILICCLLLNKISLATVFIPFALYTFGRGWSQPNNQAAAIATSPDKKATASGLLGFIQVVCGAAAAQIAPAILGVGLAWVFLAIFVLLITSAFSFLSTLSVRKAYS